MVIPCFRYTNFPFSNQMNIEEKKNTEVAHGWQLVNDPACMLLNKMKGPDSK
jgi:hypothetical protein